MTVSVRYWRDHAEQTAEFPTLHAALEFLVAGERNRAFYGLELIPDGLLVYDAIAPDEPTRLLASGRSAPLDWRKVRDFLALDD